MLITTLILIGIILGSITIISSLVGIIMVIQLLRYDRAQRKKEAMKNEKQEEEDYNLEI